MIFQWIVLFIIISFIVLSFYKQYSLKTRLISLITVAIISLVLVVIPIFKFSIATLLGLFLIEKIWIIMAGVLFIEALIEKRSKPIKVIAAAGCVIIYLYLRTMI